jgi:hypothetical protein
MVLENITTLLDANSNPVLMATNSTAVTLTLAQQQQKIIQATQVLASAQAAAARTATAVTDAQTTLTNEQNILAVMQGPQITTPVSTLADALVTLNVSTTVNTAAPASTAQTAL